MRVVLVIVIFSCVLIASMLALYEYKQCDDLKNDIVSLTLDLQEAKSDIEEDNQKLESLYKNIKLLDYQVDVLAGALRDRA